MSKEVKQTSNSELPPSRSTLIKIDEVPVGNFIGYRLRLDNGTSIDLPPVATPLVRNLTIGAEFELAPREDEIDGQLKKFDGQTSVVVTGSKKSSLRFIVSNEYILEEENTQSP